ncbi:MAG: zinc ABC transporter substrate-binding protein [Thermodesulfobacteriota bacterium]
MTKAIFCAALALCIFSLFPAAGGMADPVPVFVSILPQRYFLQKIGGARLQVSVLVPPGAEYHTYEPKPTQMAALSKARLYFAIGAPFEAAWLPRFTSVNPAMRIVHTDEGIERIPMETHDHHGEDNHPEGEQDPHTWLSPPNVKIMARNIAAALREADPAHRAEYDENGRRFIREIDELDAELRGIFAGSKGLRFMVFHPAWGYFARAYGLKQVPVEIEGKEPKPAQLKALIEEARKGGIKVIFVQPQFSTRSAETIAKAIGGQVVLADPLHPDWAGNLREQAARFKAALK